MIVLGTVLALIGTDLVLPAIPSLPEALDGTLIEAQWVLATFAAGSAVGLIVFGELGARYDHQRILIIALACYGLLSWFAIYVPDLTSLVVLRFFQGGFAAAPAVFAPGMIRRLFDEQRAMRAIGVMSSIESLAPALAPILGLALIAWFDWRATFSSIAIAAALLTVFWLFAGHRVPASQRMGRTGGYGVLLKNPVFMRYALSQAMTLGGLLIFVFGAPSVFVNVMGGTINDFVIMQVSGIVFFIICANLADRLVARWGNEAVIFFGSAMSTVGFIALCVFALTGRQTFEPIWLLFIISNAGLGLRGPPGFLSAIIAAGKDDARGAALVVLFILITVATGTAAVAPLIDRGLIPLLLVATAVSAIGPLLLRLLPPLEQAKSVPVKTD